MDFENSMKLEIISLSQNEAFARTVVAAFASQLDPTLDEISDVKTAVSEAVTNSIIHGYENTQGIITVKADIKDNLLTVEVIDNGKGIEDIEAARQPLYTSKPELERSGMGFTVMETFMDSVDVISELGKGTRVLMTKKFNSVA
ncbi:anti-sigma F factor [Oxobacter pfennigii]|uniref:Anti-sigma F factor n=1 Tax=Oxobacter pfennigii TaxID=36849 RepID=A0A0P8WC92_9CLOT|nr:anti-sigma F factor [Oxobacter pfennigii]KPU45348.1 anti-sigma F factor [Oxobacter pfennigii]